MKIYVVTWGFWDSYEVRGLFDKLRKAKKYIANSKDKNNLYIGEYVLNKTEK